MSTAATIVGYVLIVAACIVCVLLSAGYVWSTIEEWHYRIIGRAVDRALRDKARGMAGQKHWFETAEQRAMWRACAEVMGEPSYPDAGYVRDKMLARLTAEEQRP